MSQVLSRLPEQKGGSLAVLSTGTKNWAPFWEVVVPWARSRSVVINTVSMGDSADPHMLELALDTGGKAHFVDGNTHGSSTKLELAILESCTGQADESSRPVLVGCEIRW